MPTLQSQMKINAPAEKVFDYLADFSRHHEWAKHPLEIKAESTGPLAVGSKFSSTAKMMGTHHAQIVVTKLERPSTLAYEAEDDSGRFAHSMTLQQDGDGIVLHKDVRMLSGPTMSKMMAALLMPLMGRKIIRQDVERIKARVEA